MKFLRPKAKFVFVSNVRHISHQLHAIGYVEEPVDLVLARRVRRASRHVTRNMRVHDLGVGQYWPYFFIKLGIRRMSWAVKIEHVLQGRAASRFMGADVVHCVEGLWGASGRRKRKDQFLVIERRNLHHEEFEKFHSDVPGFPQTAFNIDPIRVFLDREYREADRIIVYSEAAKTSFVTRGYAPEKICVVPLPFGVKSAPLKVKYVSNPKKALFVGRCSADKGVDIAAAAIERMPGWSLTVVGPAAPAIRAWLEAKDKTQYVGVQDHASVMRLMVNHDLLLLPSTESYGLVALEAIGCGLPVMVSRDTGAADLIAKFTPECVVGRKVEDVIGFLKEFEQVDSLGQTLIAERQRGVLRLVDFEKALSLQLSVYRAAGLATRREVL